MWLCAVTMSRLPSLWGFWLGCQAARRHCITPSFFGVRIVHGARFGSDQRPHVTPEKARGKRPYLYLHQMRKRRLLLASKRRFCIRPARIGCPFPLYQVRRAACASRHGGARPNSPRAGPCLARHGGAGSFGIGTARFLPYKKRGCAALKRRSRRGLTPSAGSLFNSPQPRALRVGVRLSASRAPSAGP